MFKKIVVPLDGSKLAEGVLPAVREIARCMGSEVHLIEVVSYPHFEYPLADSELATSIIEDMEKRGREYLQLMATGLAAEGIIASSTVVTVVGGVADAIIEFAHAQAADLIAMSTHGRTGPSRWFLGSVADRVMRGAGVPVLLFRPKK